MDVNAFGKRLLDDGIDTNGVAWGKDGTLQFADSVLPSVREAVTARRDEAVQEEQGE